MKIDLFSSKMDQIANEYKLKFVVVFGSAAADKLKEQSDIDVAVLPEKGIELKSRTFFSLMDRFSELYGDRRKIDLVDLAKANTLLRYEIVTGGKLIYGDAIDYAHYRTFALRDYIDSQSLRSLEQRLIVKRQQFLAKVIAAAV